MCAYGLNLEDHYTAPKGLNHATISATTWAISE